jgi:DNA-binding beta-propeller fold protein YncE
MRSALPVFLLICLPTAAQVAPIPTPTQLPGDPFYIRKNWQIGGAGSWDYLTIDPAAQRLYIAHDHSVQVVDLESGALTAHIDGFREAHAIALDDENTNGYVSDGPASAVKVFDRRTLSVESSIPVGCSPRSIAYEPASKLVFAICGADISSPSPAHPARPGDRPQQPAALGVSHIIAIDTAGNNQILADLTVPGDLRVVQTDGSGHVYITASGSQYPMVRNGSTVIGTIPSRIVVLESATLVNAVHRQFTEHEQQESGGSAHFDVDEGQNANNDNGSLVQFLLLPSDCPGPQGLAIDSHNSRLFAACDNQKLLVLDAANGHAVTTLTTGPGDDVIAYDADRNLIFSANGAGYGSLTIIRQDATADTYAVIENLPTMARARTLAIDPSTGIVYLVTDTMGVDLSPRGALTNIKPAAIQGSFQVIVVGH